LSGNTIRKGIRRGKEKYYCKDCQRWWQINRVQEKLSSQQLAADHLNGLSFRKLAAKYEISVGNAHLRVIAYFKTLPHCADITRDYCSRFCNIFLIDGKYVRVQPYERKIPVIYLIDYQAHDVVTFKLAKSESLLAAQSVYTSANYAGVGIQMVVGDDNPNFSESLKFVYPNAQYQLCHNHFKQNLRQQLGLFRDLTHYKFMKEIETLLGVKQSQGEFSQRAHKLITKYKAIPLYMNVLLNIAQRQDQLLAYHHLKGTPITTNLIEAFNSHLQARLSSIGSFQDFTHAKLWLNAYFLKRRQTKFTDCSRKFRRLNGKTSLSQTQKPLLDIPRFF